MKDGVLSSPALIGGSASWRTWAQAGRAALARGDFANAEVWLRTAVERPGADDASLSASVRAGWAWSLFQLGRQPESALQATVAATTLASIADSAERSLATARMHQIQGAEKFASGDWMGAFTNYQKAKDLRAGGAGGAQTAVLSMGRESLALEELLGEAADIVERWDVSAAAWRQAAFSLAAIEPRDETAYRHALARWATAEVRQHRERSAAFPFRTWLRSPRKWPKKSYEAEKQAFDLADMGFLALSLGRKKEAQTLSQELHSWLEVEPESQSELHFTADLLKLETTLDDSNAADLPRLCGLMALRTTTRPEAFARFRMVEAAAARRIGAIRRSAELWDGVLTLIRSLCAGRWDLEVVSLLNASHSAVLEGRNIEAIGLVEQATSIAVRPFNGGHPLLAECLAHHALALIRGDGGEAAGPLLDEALQRVGPRGGPLPIDQAEWLAWRAEYHWCSGGMERGVEDIRRALDLVDKEGGNVAAVRLAAGRLAHAQGKFNDAQSHLAMAADAWNQRELEIGAPHPESSSVIFALSALYRAWGVTEQAEELLCEGLPLLCRMTVERTAAAFELCRLGNAYLRWKGAPEAEAFYRHSLQIYRETLPPSHPHVQQMELNWKRALHGSSH